MAMFMKGLILTPVLMWTLSDASVTKYSSVEHLQWPNTTAKLYYGVRSQMHCTLLCGNNVPLELHYFDQEANSCHIFDFATPGTSVPTGSIPYKMFLVSDDADYTDTYVMYDVGAQIWQSPFSETKMMASYNQCSRECFSRDCDVFIFHAFACHTGSLDHYEGGSTGLPETAESITVNINSLNDVISKRMVLIEAVPGPQWSTNIYLHLTEVKNETQCAFRCIMEYSHRCHYFVYDGSDCFLGNKLFDSPPAVIAERSDDQDVYEYWANYMLLRQDRQLEDSLFVSSDWLVNQDNPTAGKYSIVKHIEDFRSCDGSFHFYLKYPLLNSAPNEWRQTNDPSQSTAVTGFEAISLEYPTDFSGCFLQSGSGSMMECDSKGTWWYALGCEVAFDTEGIPGPKGPNRPTKLIEFYVKQEC